MIFPKNIRSMEDRSKKVSGDDTKGAIIVLLIVVSFLLYLFVTSPVVTATGISTGLGLLIQAVVEFLIALPLIRFKVIREDELRKETRYEDSEDFSNYYHLRKESKSGIRLHSIASSSVPVVNVFEYTNRTFCCAIRFRYGSNKDEVAETTEEFFQAVFREIALQDFNYKLYNMVENYEDSRECVNYLDAMSGKKNGDIVDERLSKYMMEVANLSLDLTRKFSNLYCTTILITTRESYQIHDLDRLISSIVRLLRSRKTAIRYIEFLKEDDMTKFLKDYNGLNALDMAMVKPVEVNQNLMRSMRDLVSVYGIYTSEGEFIEREDLLHKYCKTPVYEVIMKNGEPTLSKPKRSKKDLEIENDEDEEEEDIDDINEDELLRDLEELENNANKEEALIEQV